MSWQDVRSFYEEAYGPEEILRAIDAKARATHTFCDCGNDGCYPCQTGLSFCTVCKGGEGDLPYECPKQKMMTDQMADVLAQRLDFIAGEWRVPPKRTQEESSEGK